MHGPAAHAAALKALHVSLPRAAVLSLRVKKHSWSKASALLRCQCATSGQQRHARPPRVLKRVSVRPAVSPVGMPAEYDAQEHLRRLASTIVATTALRRHTTNTRSADRERDIAWHRAGPKVLPRFTSADPKHGPKKVLVSGTPHTFSTSDPKSGAKF